MGVRVSRTLMYSDRFGKQQATYGGMFQLHQITYADRAIQGDPIRALVELITNCDDAYNKKASNGQTEPGIIKISVSKGSDYPYLTIHDKSIGMSGERMDEALGSYTSATSVGTDRGYFGRGLKDGILALGEGEVESIVDNTLHKAWLGIRNGFPYYEAQDPIPVEGKRTTGSSTTVRIKVNRPDVTLPTYRDLSEQIPLHFMLRNILSNPARKIILTELSPEGEMLQQKHLSYRHPPSRLVLDNSLYLSKLDIPYRIIVYKADHSLLTPREAGPYAEAGILISDGNAIFDNILGRFDTHPDANVFFGKFICPHLNELMRNNEAIVQATRQGLVWTHEVARELRLTLDERLEPLIHDWARQTVVPRRTQGRESLQARLKEALAELNQIANGELSASPAAAQGSRADDTSLRQSDVFHQIVFDDSNQDNPRARFDRQSCDIIISTAHPSIAHYISGDAQDGIESPQGQVILAELVLEVFSRELASLQADSGAVERNEHALQTQTLHLQDLYSNRIHAILVERKYRLRSILQTEG